ncbi:MAG: hypothetical protein AB1458_00960 [Bacteroidota bacterium]
MSGRLQLIEQKLKAIDSAAFQNLCDIYLARREETLRSFNRTGSQLGKQKTVKGTPDTFFRLDDGSLRYVEYTTKADDLVSKIKGDIDSCLDETKTGVPISEINKIIICFNSRLEPGEEKEITEYGNSRRVNLELIGLDWLAIEILSKYLILAKEILNIPLDTGQILPLDKFVQEYDNKANNLATPLDNEFLHRKAELSEIENALSGMDLFIISGAAGVGKTKIGLEATQHFLKNNPSYMAYAITKKGGDIFEDLKIQLEQDKDYILLVDDANRQLPNLEQILGVFKEKRKGNLKLILTVRQYALNDILALCIGLAHEKIELEKFSDEEITEIIKSPSFNIQNSEYQSKIINVADGNARLAIMAARLANQKQHDFLWGNVADLYDAYFQTFIKDIDLFNNTVQLKTLGIISFFFTINRKNKEFINKLLGLFEIDSYQFNETLDELHRKELIEIQYDHAKVSEQVMSTYFFYKTFIKDQILSFEVLLENYIDSLPVRFQDTIIPSNNAFGYESVIEKISQTLSNYFNKIVSDEQKALSFIELFWFYKQDETLAYFQKQISRLPEPVKPIYNTDYETNDFVWDRDKTLDYLSAFFKYPFENFIPALELSFEYCRKRPEHLAELVRRIRENVVFGPEDRTVDFSRQKKLFELLISKALEGQEHYRNVFFALASTFLAHQFQITKAGRKNQIIIAQYPLPNIASIEEFRIELWTTVFKFFDTFPEQVRKIIKQQSSQGREITKTLLEADVKLLMPFIDEKLTPLEFKDVILVQNLIHYWDRRDLSDRSYQKWKSAFSSKEYLLFRKLDWNRLRDKEDYEFDNYDKYQQVKEKDIRLAFGFKDSTEFTALFTAVSHYLEVTGNPWSLFQSLDIIIDENLKQNLNLGLELMKELISRYPEHLHSLPRSMKHLTSQSCDTADTLWQLLKKCNHERNIFLKLSFFDYLPEVCVSNAYKIELINTLKSIQIPCTVFTDSYSKYLSKDSKLINGFKKIASAIPFISEYLYNNILEEALEVIIYKIEKEKINISLSNNFFENYTTYIKKNPSLLIKAYIQQEQIHSHFDYNRDGLRKLVELDPNYLLDFVKSFYGDPKKWSKDTHNDLSFVWEIEGAELLLEKAVEIIVSNEFYMGVGKHSLNIFFKRFKEESIKQKAYNFLINYITKHNSDTQRMNAVFDVFRHTMKEFFEPAFLHYLSLNTNEESFKEIWWRGNGSGVVSGDVNFGELEEKDWQRILSIVNKAKNNVELIPIKAYIKKEIERALRYAEHERKRKFIDPNY